jgi:hypothetical protein
MKGEWRVKSGRYLPFFRRAKELAGLFTNIAYIWIPREKNCAADALSKKVLRQMGIGFRIQPGEVTSQSGGRR